MANCILSGNKPISGSGSSVVFPSCNFKNVGTTSCLPITSDGWVDYTQNTFTNNNVNYLELSNIFTPGSQAWEMCFKIRFTQTNSHLNTIIGNDAFTVPYIGYTGNIQSQWVSPRHFFVGYTVSPTEYIMYELYSQNSFAMDGDYCVKMVWDTEYVKLYVSSNDGVTWSLEASQAVSDPHYQQSNSPIYIGTKAITSSSSMADQLFNCGSINIMHSYIKFGNTVVWGNE